MLYLSFALGVLAGVLAMLLVVCRKAVGTLLIDTSDPTSDPVLLLDLDKPVKDFMDDRQVNVKVRKLRARSQN